MGDLEALPRCPCGSAVHSVVKRSGRVFETAPLEQARVTLSPCGHTLIDGTRAYAEWSAAYAVYRARIDKGSTDG